MNGIIVTNNHQYHLGLVKDQWVLTSDDASAIINTIRNTASDLNNEFTFNQAEINLITKFTDFIETDKTFQFSLKHDIDPTELMDTIRYKLSNYLDIVAERAELPFSLKEYITVENVKAFLDTNPQIT